MGILPRRQRGVSAANIDRYQRAFDPVTDGNEFIQKTWQELRFDMVHPWHADNLTLRQMGYAALAVSLDRTAEALRASSVVGKRRKTQLTPDAAQFALDLTRLSAKDMDKGVKGVMPTQEHVDFTDPKTINSLRPENMVPSWPRSDEGQPRMPWQGANSPVVTPGFMKGIIEASRLVQADAMNAVSYLTNPERTGVPVPPEYTAMGAVIGDIVMRANANLDQADQTIYLLGNDLTADIKHDTYVQVHDGYIYSVGAALASVCPPSLGQKFFPERDGA